MDAKAHGEQVYTSKAPDPVSWYRRHFEISLELIERAAGARSAPIIDVGISLTAIDVSNGRLGSAAVLFIGVTDATEIEARQPNLDSIQKTLKKESEKA